VTKIMQTCQLYRALWAGALVALLLAILPMPSFGQTLDTAAITDVLGRNGQMLSGDVYKVGFPRTDLKVSVGGVVLKPGLALGSYAVFKQYPNGTLVMGDLVLLSNEVEPVMKALEENGIQITALHNHLLEANPRIWYMHYMGLGEARKLAVIIGRALAYSKTPLGPTTAAAAAPSPWFETPVEQALGHQGKVAGGVLSISVPRAVDETSGGMTTPAAMGTAEAMNFQDAGNGKVATTGDFSLTADEVAPALRALRDHDIDVEALHSHMLDDNPRLFYVHWWAVGDPGTIATGLKAALDHIHTR